MIVEEIMQRQVYTLKADDPIAKGWKLCNLHHIRHFPVVDEDMKVIGIVSDRDLRDASPSILHDCNRKQEELEKPVSTVMTREVITGHPLDFVEEISAIFYEEEIGCMPIIRDQKLVGIVTATDLLNTFVRLTGANQPGSQLEVKVPNKAGILAEVTAVIGRHKVNVSSVLVYPGKTDDYKILVFRVQTINPMNIIHDLKGEGYEVLWPNLPGVSS